VRDGLVTEKRGGKKLLSDYRRARVYEKDAPLLVIEVFHKANTYVDESIRFDREAN
jgi:hypothetical protein